jgi:hypothetical protein
MISQAVQNAIREATESADFRPLFDHFADDVELGITIVGGSGVSERYRGKRSVIDRLRSIAHGESRPIDEFPDLFASGERIVAFRDQRLAVGIGLTIHSECVLVFDVHDGLITRLSISHELSTVLDPQPKQTAPVRLHNVDSADQVPTLAIG